jgi:hypothetical protein
MPSSLVFAALAVAWIVVLVPMVARRRQEVRRTADSALAARVLRRGDAHDRPEEVLDMADDAYDDDLVDHPDHRDLADDPDLDERYEDGRTGRRYRPGRGGFDQEAAELAARAKYAYRQRVVLALLAFAVVTGLLAGFAVPVLWWAHGGIDTLLVGYLVYLRRQVRIEQEVRQRRIDRAARGRRRREHEEIEEHQEPDSYARSYTTDTDADLADVDADAHDAEPEPVRPRRPQLPPHPHAAIIDLDDEDPGLCELDGDHLAPYRRAAGE